MLPLEGIFFVPSLFVTPVAVVALIWARSWPFYPRLWRTALIACFVLTGLFASIAIGTPFYSELDHRLDNPDGPAGSVLVVVTLLAVQTCVVIPAFPMLVALACLPPLRRDTRLVVAVLLYVGVLGGLTAWKNAAYIKDYRAVKAIPQQTPFDRFKHLRDNPDAAGN